MKRDFGYAAVWALAFWLLFGAIACEESSTEVNVVQPDTLFVVGLTCPDTAFVTLPTDTIFVQGCPPGYHWDAHKLRCHHGHGHDHDHDDDDDDRGDG